MTVQHPDVVIRYIKTKNKTRKLATYPSYDCDLRIKHETISKFISERFIPSPFTKGYVKNRSIYHNAVAHLYNDYFIMMDIKDFFPHICHKQLTEKLFYELNLKQKGQISRKECNDIVGICSISSRGLPLGFITSPLLSNVYMKEFDGVFYGKLKKLGLPNVIYTRYADDLTVSFKSDSIEKLQACEDSITEIAAVLLSRYGLQLNRRKTRAYNMNISNHVRITGVNITKQDNGSRRLTVGRSVKNNLYWEALNCLEDKNPDKISHVKGLQSFVLSIEKTGYESCYSPVMMAKVRSYGFETLKELIDSL